MDQVMVDCGDAPVVEGDEVIFFGSGEHGAPTAAEWAGKLGTIHYEVVAGMVRPRLIRTVQGRRPVALISAQSSNGALDRLGGAR
jgi:alanine racemase